MVVSELLAINVVNKRIIDTILTLKQLLLAPILFFKTNILPFNRAVVLFNLYKYFEVAIIKFFSNNFIKNGLINSS